MTQRTFRQWGQGFGFSPVVITATIDDQVVYQGPVPTYAKSCERPNHHPELIFQWQAPIEFDGTKSFRIAVSGGTLLLAETEANHLLVANLASPIGDRLATTSKFDDGVVGRGVHPGGPDLFGSFYQFELEPDKLCTDPLSNVRINGEPRQADRNEADGMTGQWYWQVGNGDVFESDINVIAGVLAAQWQSDREYDSRSFVEWNNRIYMTWLPVSKGIDPSDRYHWIPVPISLWQPNQSYRRYDRVWNDNDVWVCLQDAPAGTSIHDAQYWENIFPNWHTPK